MKCELYLLVKLNCSLEIASTAGRQEEEHQDRSRIAGRDKNMQNRHRSLKMQLQSHADIGLCKKVKFGKKAAFSFCCFHLCCAGHIAPLVYPTARL